MGRGCWTGPDPQHLQAVGIHSSSGTAGLRWQEGPSKTESAFSLLGSFLLAKQKGRQLRLSPASCLGSTLKMEHHSVGPVPGQGAHTVPVRPRPLRCSTSIVGPGSAWAWGVGSGPYRGLSSSWAPAPPSQATYARHTQALMDMLVPSLPSACL